MATPNVSVCLPTYEPDSTLLHEAVHSVLAQTEADWELLMHDDCSAADVHGTMEVFLSDPRVRFVRTTQHLGIGGNWNAAARMGSAPVIAYLFQDDRWHPRYLARALEAMERHPTAGIVALQHRYDIATHDETSDAYRALEALRADAFRKGFSDGTTFLRAWLRKGLHPNVVGEPDFIVIKRDVLERAGWWDESMRQCLDIDGIARMLLLTDIAFVTDESGTFRVHSNAASAQNYRDRRGMFDRIQVLLRSAMRGPLSVRFSALLGMLKALPGMAGKMIRRLTRTSPSAPSRR